MHELRAYLRGSVAEASEQQCDNMNSSSSDFRLLLSLYQGSETGTELWAPSQTQRRGRHQQKQTLGEKKTLNIMQMKQFLRLPNDTLIWGHSQNHDWRNNEVVLYEWRLLGVRHFDFDSSSVLISSCCVFPCHSSWDLLWVLLSLDACAGGSHWFLVDGRFIHYPNV